MGNNLRLGRDPGRLHLEVRSKDINSKWEENTEQEAGKEYSRDFGLKNKSVGLLSFLTLPALICAARLVADVAGHSSAREAGRLAVTKTGKMEIE